MYGRIALVAFALVSVATARAQPSPGGRALEPVADVLLDADHDLVPDRVGDTVRVAGRATVATGRLHDRYLRLYVQDATGGVKLFARDVERPVAAGDSVVVTGVVDHFRGQTQLRPLDYRVVPAPRRLPGPLGVALERAAQERYEGRLVSTWGQIVGIGATSAGSYLELQGADTTRAPLHVFIDRTRAPAFDLSAFSVGDVISVTGLLGQFDDAPPFAENYQLYPRSAADLSPVGFTQRWLKGAGLVVLLVLLATVLWLATLRVQVRRRTAELQASEERFRRFTAATVEGLLFHEEGRVVDVNAALCRLGGYRAEELLGRDVAELVAPDDRPLLRQAVERRLQGRYEITALRRDGTTFAAEVHARTLVFEGRELRMAAVRDVTLQHEHEAAVVAARERAEEMVRLKSTLLDNMSHELRTPISAIIGFADVIREEAPDVYAEFAGHIHRSGVRLLGTLNAVLEVAQLESGTYRPVPCAVCAVDVVREVVTDLTRQAADKGVPLALHAPEEPLAMTTDPQMLRRITEHLVDNAVKYTDEGRVEVEVVLDGEDGVRLTVADTGVGISPVFLPHVFDLFRQESHGLSRTHTGAGLGLSITHRMVRLLRGTVEVDSTPDEGSVFTVRLPRHAAAERQQAA